MQENYTIAEEYTSPYSGITEVLTVHVITNTGTLPDGSANTHTVIGARASDLDSPNLTFSIGSTDLSFTDVLLQDLAVSYMIRHSGATDTTFYSGFTSAFRKDVPGTTLAFTVDSGETFTSGDTVDVYTLSSGSGQTQADLLESQIPFVATSTLESLKREVDAIVNVDLFSKLTAAGFRYDK